MRNELNSVAIFCCRNVDVYIIINIYTRKFEESTRHLVEISTLTLTTSHFKRKEYKQYKHTLNR